MKFSVKQHMTVKDFGYVHSRFGYGISYLSDNSRIKKKTMKVYL